MKNINKLIFLILFLTLIKFDVYSESVFTWDLKKDIAIGAFSLGLFFGAYLMSNEPEVPTNLNRNDVNAFDRGLMFPRDQALYDVRYLQMFVLSVLPIVSPLAVTRGNVRRNLDTWLTYGIMYAQAVFLTYGTRMLIGNVVNRYRPHEYFDNPTHPIKNNSFPSGTTAIAFMPATFLSVTFSAEFPDSPWRIPLIVGSYTLATAVGVTRIFSGAHFLTDVLAGAAIGSLYGWLIPTLHRRKNIEGNRISPLFTGNGIMLSLKF